MFLKLREISSLLTTGRFKLFFRASFVFIFILPTLLFMAIGTKKYSEESTRAIMKTKESQGLLAATIVQEKLNSYFDLCHSFATRPLLIHYIEQGNWNKALQVLEGVLEQYEAIDRIVLFSTRAMIMADMPAAGVIGQSRADKQWFRDFSKTQEPHLSGVYQRGAEPKINVVSMIIPIYSIDSQQKKSTPEKKLIAIMQVQLKLYIFYTWMHADLGVGGLIYLVDQYGMIVHHAHYDNHATLVDFSSVHIVRKALSGNNGVELNYNPVDKEQRIAAYRFIPKYGWVLVVTQAADKAFAERDRNVRIFFTIYLLIFILSLVLSLTILYIIIHQKTIQEKLNALALNDELTGLYNRRGFMTLAAQQMLTADRLKHKLFLAYIDIDKMKLINDRFGHAEGDRAIMNSTRIIKTVFRDIDIKARIGGDEFIVLGIIGAEFNDQAIADRLQSACSRFAGEQTRPYDLRFSFGIVLYDPVEPCSLDELMERGDQLMYNQKQTRL